MKYCENCQVEHDGSYASGRFCSSKCSRSFSTKAKRKEINSTVSAKLKGREVNGGKPFQKGYDERRKVLSDQDRIKANEASQKKREELYNSLEFIELPLAEKRRIILTEQNNKCSGCGIDSWLGNPIILELHHIDGEHSNNSKENLTFLCPNCHSQTDSWRKIKSSR